MTIMSIMTCDKLVVLNVIGDLCWVVLIVIDGVDCNYNWVSLMTVDLLTLMTIIHHNDLRQTGGVGC